MSTSTTGARASVAPRQAEVRCGPAIGEQLLADHFRIRRAVFVEEQCLFQGSDRDVHDEDPDVVHVLATVGSLPVGTVRIFPLDARRELWQGDRLAVLPEHRVHGAGAPLVRFAVAWARAQGGRQMVAHIQLPNVLFFRRLGWSLGGPVETYLGVEHQPMAIDLSGAL
jgi:putative N-acetyltransferase (TIGR04045 family)